MKKLVDTEEAARMLGITPRAIRKRINQGKMKYEFSKGDKGGGRSGQILKVWIDDDPSAECGVRNAESKKKTKPKNRPADAKALAGRYRVKRGEPGRNIMTPFENGEPVLISNIPEGTDEKPVGAPLLPIPLLAAPSGQAGDGGELLARNEENLDSGFRRNDKMERIANLRFALVSAFNEEASKNHRPKKQIIEKFIESFNMGLLLPDLKTEIRKLKRSTLYTWLQMHERGGVDALAPQYTGAKAVPITEAEKKFLLTKLLDQNKPTIGDTINKCKWLLGNESPSSGSKLRRWVNDFRKNNYDLWTLEREGEKALNDKCVPYAERDWRDLTVGEAVVADGHKLNCQVVNPFTGKPSRAMMVLFWDWKSSYPLGWEIMLTESIQCVVAALRNAVITLGKFPKHALLDNGKAFRANIFRKKFRFQETEIPGIFAKLNIIPHYALPYNAQSKPVERFFRTFNDWFERELPSYTGASIPDKPPRMNRNEKRAQDLHDEWVPTIPEAMELIFRWREYYADQRLKARDGQRPRDIFDAEKGPGVDPFALHFLMMTCKARMVHRNGITWNGWHWYHESLYGFKDYVLMFYSYYDLSQVYIFTMKNEFLCVAKPVEKVLPFAADSEFPEDMAAVQRINALKRKAVNTTKKLADTLQSQKNLYIDWNRKFRDEPEVAEAIQKIEETKKSKVVRLSPWASEIEAATSVPARLDALPANVEQATSRPRFQYDFEKYEWLMDQTLGSITDDDRRWLDHYVATASVFKHATAGGEK